MARAHCAPLTHAPIALPQETISARSLALIMVKSVPVHSQRPHLSHVFIAALKALPNGLILQQLASKSSFTAEIQCTPEPTVAMRAHSCARRPEHSRLPIVCTAVSHCCAIDKAVAAALKLTTDGMQYMDFILCSRNTADAQCMWSP